ncbi:MAG: caspase family protein, partial [Ekhidna sp.]|nr:caspase family protein [Ekhidna sp.]
GKFARIGIVQDFVGSTSRMSPDGQYLSGFIAAFEKGKPISKYVVFHIKSGEMILETKASGLYSAFSHDSRAVAISSHLGIELFELTTGKRLAQLDHLKANHIAFSEDKILTSGPDGFSRLWSYPDGKEIVGLVSFRDHENTVVTPEGYYFSTGSAVDGIHYINEDKAISFDQFDARYNRPDLVVQVMGGKDEKLIKAYKNAYIKRLQKLGAQPHEFAKDFHTPTMALDDSQIKAVSSQGSVRLKISALDDKYELKKLVISVNNVPIYGKNGFPITGSNYDGEFEIALSPGRNKIAAYAVNQNGAKSIEQSCETNYTSEKKGRLYLIAIGVSEYMDSSGSFNLNYAAKDAQDFVELLGERNGYEDIIVKTLLNSEATRANVLSTRAILDQSKVEDQVIVFVASHGVLDSDYNYYLAMHNMDFNNPHDGGLSYSELDELLDGIPARKRLVLIDACHSGEVDKEFIIERETKQRLTDGKNLKFRGFDHLTATSQIGLQNSFELMKSTFTDLRRGTGAVVISAAGGLESAIEDTQWSKTGNGAFTYSIIEGVLSGNADLNGDKKVVVTELKDYVSNKVSEITRGIQNPTSRQDNYEYDFEIFKLNHN